MTPGTTPREAHHHFVARQGEVFQAAIETVRSMPGWEVLTAHPETGEIRVRSRGRFFSPSMDHQLRLIGDEDGTDLELVSQGLNKDPARIDEKSVAMFEVLLEDRLARGHFGPYERPRTKE